MAKGMKYYTGTFTLNLILACQKASFWHSTEGCYMIIGEYIRLDQSMKVVPSKRRLAIELNNYFFFTGLWKFGLRPDNYDRSYLTNCVHALIILLIIYYIIY